MNLKGCKSFFLGKLQKEIEAELDYRADIAYDTQRDKAMIEELESDHEEFKPSWA